MKKTVILWLAVVAILFAQMLQLCLRVLDVADTAHVHAAAIHVESHFNVDAGPDGPPTDDHVAFVFAFVKKIFGDSLAPTLVALIVLFMLGPVLPAYRPRPVVAPACPGHYRRPPLRAPPR